MWALILLHCYVADCTHNPEDGLRPAFKVETVQHFKTFEACVKAGQAKVLNQEDDEVINFTCNRSR